MTATAGQNLLALREELRLTQDAEVIGQVIGVAMRLGRWRVVSHDQHSEVPRLQS
jgi:hypothetical protein